MVILLIIIAYYAILIFNLEFDLNNYKNCYDQCPYYHYYDIETKEYHCSYSCPDDYPIVNETIKECFKNESNQYESSEITIEEVSDKSSEINEKYSSIENENSDKYTIISTGIGIEDNSYKSNEITNK